MRSWLATLSVAGALTVAATTTIPLTQSYYFDAETLGASSSAGTWCDGDCDPDASGGEPDASVVGHGDDPATGPAAVETSTADVHHTHSSDGDDDEASDGPDDEPTPDASPGPSTQPSPDVTAAPSSEPSSGPAAEPEPTDGPTSVSSVEGATAPLGS